MVSKHNYDKKNIEHLTLIPPFKEDTMTKTEMHHLFRNSFGPKLNEMNYCGQSLVQNTVLDDKIPY